MTETLQANREIIMSDQAIGEAIAEMARRLSRLASDSANVALVGIRRRGVPLAERLRAALAPDNPERIPLGQLDITLYRDDLSSLGPQPIVGPTELPFDVDGHTVILVDDVIFTGRTARAALEALLAFGRPRAIRLAVLVDRGWRECPIQPDIAGITIDTELGQSVEVQLNETDSEECVVLVTPRSPQGAQP